MSPTASILKDGDAWLAVDPEFVGLQRPPAGFGDTQLEAIRVLRTA